MNWRFYLRIYPIFTFLFLSSCEILASSNDTVKSEPISTPAMATQLSSPEIEEYITETSPPSEINVPPQAEVTLNLGDQNNMSLIGTEEFWDSAEFMGDISVPDGSLFRPDEPFVKTWRIRNNGETTWSQKYALVFNKGSLMNGPPVIQLSEEVRPGQIVEISAHLIAPREPGNYRGYWNLRSESGQNFGTGGNADQAFWVDVTISASAPSESTQATGVQENPFSDVSLFVDDSTIISACPHTFTFSASITLTRSTMVTYNLEAGNLVSGLEIKLPPPTTANFDAGEHTLFYKLGFHHDLNGWARLHILSPDETFSNQVNFSLTCQ